MKVQIRAYVPLITTILLFSDCSTIKNTAGGGVPSLKETYKNDFLIGAALGARYIQRSDLRADSLIKRQFNAATPENVMKAGIIHPGWNTYRFELADQLVEYGRQNNIRINAHTLIWHNQLPGFLRNMEDADSVRAFFESHISTVASRYDGKVYSWDVVNEALNEDGTLRNSIFLQKLGPAYVTEAFRLAGKAAPHTELYYNDYGIENPRKRAGAVALVKKIQAAGIRIDGIGIQGHWQLGKVPYKNIEESIRVFSGLGIRVMITELDLSVLPEHAADPYPHGLPDSVQNNLAREYETLFRLFLQYRKQISRVTFWGVEDGHSWLNDWPVKGRTNYPLLFDRNDVPKKAFYSVIDAGKK